MSTPGKRPSGNDLFAVTAGENGGEVGFITAIIERIRQDGPAFNPTALILVPTRARAIQIHEAAFQLTSRGEDATVLGLIEGKPVTSQIGPLKHGVDIVVGTPARVLEHVKLKTLRIEQLKILVLDQLDEMLDHRLGRDLETIVRATPKTRRTVACTSRTSEPVIAFARKNLREDPELAGIEPSELEPAAPEVKEPATEQVNIYFGVGKGAGVSPRDLVGAITNEGGLSGDHIGEIKIKQNFSLVAVPADDAQSIVSKMKSSRINGRKVKIRLERF